MRNHFVKFLQLNRAQLSTNTEGSDDSAPQGDEALSQSVILPKNMSMKQRFKLNQAQLQSKFKKYLNKYNLRLQASPEQILSEFTTESPTLRELRREKESMFEELKATLNQRKYMEQKRDEKLKTFYQIRHKYERIEQIRQRHHSESMELSRSRLHLQKAILKQKVQQKHAVDQSRYRSTESRKKCFELNQSMAAWARVERDRHRGIITEGVQEEYSEKRAKHNAILDSQKLVPIVVVKVAEKKQREANELKLQRIFRELASCEKLKSESNRLRGSLGTRISVMRRHTQTYESRIRQYRQSLGEIPAERMAKVQYLSTKTAFEKTSFDT